MTLSIKDKDFCENLWVINGVLTNKNIFNTNSVVYRLGGGGGDGRVELKQQNEKIRDFII